MDVSNAFNTVHRSAVLRAVRVHFPSLSPWVDCCYRRESTLFTGSGYQGVQQGDPAIAETRAVTETRTREASMFAPFFSTTASVLVPPQPFAACSH